MFARHKMLTGLVLCAALLAACATSSSRQSTAQQLTTIMAGDQRTKPTGRAMSTAIPRRHCCSSASVRR